MFGGGRSTNPHQSYFSFLKKIIKILTEGGIIFFSRGDFYWKGSGTLQNIHKLSQKLWEDHFILFQQLTRSFSTDKTHRRRSCYNKITKCSPFMRNLYRTLWTIMQVILQLSSVQYALTCFAPGQNFILKFHFLLVYKIPPPQIIYFHKYYASV